MKRAKPGRAGGYAIASQKKDLAIIEQQVQKAEIFYELTPEIANRLTNAPLSATAYRLWIYLSSLYQSNAGFEYIPSQSELANRLEVSCRSIARAINELEKINLWGFPINKSKEKRNLEQQIRDALKVLLGGQSEVITSAGRIDLLTDTQIIEVKRVDEWKSALGQVLAYSAFFPSHQKRIHLFGTAMALKKLPDIESACLAFDVLVTGEEAK